MKLFYKSKDSYSYDIIENKYTCHSSSSSCPEGQIMGSTKCMDCSKTNPFCESLSADDCSACSECKSGTMENENGICENKDNYCIASKGSECEGCVSGRTALSG